MRSSNKSTAASSIANAGRYLKRASREPGVRDQAKIALQSVQSAYRRIERAKAPREALLNDKKVHRDLRRALAASRDAAAALTAPPRMRTRDAIGVGAVVTVLLIAATFGFTRSRNRRAGTQGEGPGTVPAGADAAPVAAPEAEAPRTSAPPS